MPFAKSCRITSDIKLEGHDRALGHGGWGHVVYHTYPTDAIRTYTGREDYNEVVRLYKHSGADPTGLPAATAVSGAALGLAPGQSRVLLERGQAGCVSAVRMQLTDMKPKHLNSLWLRFSWDGAENPDIYCPAGAFFGNSLGYNDTRYLLMGSTADGWFYNYFPMPFWQSAHISIENRSDEEIEVGFFEISLSPNIYAREEAGYFRTTPYYERRYTPGADSPIGKVSGRGKMVAAHVTAFGERNNIITCEGDVRIYIDGNRTPRIQSDGSESYVCYGWGFPTPPETNPFGGYDGLPDNPWSMTRLLIGDSYPFYNELEFSIEAGERNNQYLELSGMVFYYGADEPWLRVSDRLDIGDKKSVRSHKYRIQGEARRETLAASYEGARDTLTVEGTCVWFDDFSEFTTAIDPANRGVRLLRRSDQSSGGQRARVFVDGMEVAERAWYHADRNPYMRWLDDEFEIPESYTRGKSRITIKIVPLPNRSGETIWNEAEYIVSSYVF